MRIDANKLLLAMARKQWNFKQLSTCCGVSRATLSSIKNGKTCNVVTVGKIAKALGVDITELLED